VYSYGPAKGKPKQVGVTASGTRARPGTIAADTSVFPFGTILYVEGYGYGRVEDRGGAIKGDHIDLFFHTHRQAMAWGRKRVLVRVWLP
jgi:3D (Asp-Asp-Asp) domain-containing protein